jgi:TRAP-type mannitol/chloroaromatic compound transport system permease large subunit
MMASTTVILLFGLILLGIPVGLALIGCSLVAVLFFSSELLPSVGLSIMSTSSNYILLAIPIFIKAGELAIKGKHVEP